MNTVSLSDNIMFSIILIAFFYLNNDTKGCCSKSKIKRNERNLVDETIFYEDEDWSKILDKFEKIFSKKSKYEK